MNGVAFTGKVLVFPAAKGSSGWSGFFQACRLLGTAPVAMVITRITSPALATPSVPSQKSRTHATSRRS